MAKAFSAKQIIKKVGSDKLNLYKGEGYWYFIYDNGSNIHESRSVYCMFLNMMSFDRWVEIGKDFVLEVEQKD